MSSTSIYAQSASRKASFAQDKKNWLFIGHPEADRQGVVLYMLLMSTRNDGVDPRAYLNYVIERLPETRLLLSKVALGSPAYSRSQKSNSSRSDACMSTF